MSEPRIAETLRGARRRRHDDLGGADPSMVPLAAMQFTPEVN